MRCGGPGERRASAGAAPSGRMDRSAREDRSGRVVPSDHQVPSGRMGPLVEMEAIDMAGGVSGTVVGGVDAACSIARNCGWCC